MVLFGRIWLQEGQGKSFTAVRGQSIPRLHPLKPANKLGGPECRASWLRLTQFMCADARHAGLESNSLDPLGHQQGGRSWEQFRPWSRGALSLRMLLNKHQVFANSSEADNDNPIVFSRQVLPFGREER